MPPDVLDLGLIDYDEAWRLQETYASQISRGERSPTLLLLEHPHIYTFGTGGHAENILWSEQQLRERGVSVRWVDRGGDVTYHGPGQLVGYPLVPLGPIAAPSAETDLSTENAVRVPRADYVGYIRKLERMLIMALAQLGVAGAQIPRLTGVWVQPDVYSRCSRCRPEDRKKPAKLAAIGVRIDSHGISRHGFALNVNPDMSYWDGIIACGLSDYPLVSLSDLLASAPSIDQVKRLVADSFRQLFDSASGS
jgi:lipoate-protein ligase B